MQEPLEMRSDAQQFQWLGGLEIASVIVSFGGSAALVMMQQAALATIPLSLTAALNLVNRKRLMNAMEQSQQTAVAQLAAQDKEQQDQLDTLDQQNQAYKTLLDSIEERLVAGQDADEQLNQRVQQLQTKEEGIAKVLQKLREIDSLTQAIRTNPRNADFFFQRGQVRQSLTRMEDKRIAIEDYTQAIQLEPTLAKAYFNRGFLRSELGDKRQAVEDLRIAAKCYFDQGEMENYDEAKRLGEQIHARIERQSNPDEQPMLVQNLFA
jgi:tetratricopeptide (TPR) repeat protein